MATDFDLDIVNVSTWYDKHNLFRQLKVLYKDLITVTNIDKARKTIDLLNELRKCGRLSSDNLALLYQTIKVTEQFGIINLLQHSFLEVQKVEITKFTLYRLQIVNFGNVLRQTDIEKIDALYNGSALKNYKDAWSLIMDLEQRQILCEEKLEEFIDNLKKIGLDSTVKLLNKDGSATEAVQLTLKRKLDTEGSEKSVAHCSDTPIMYARLPKCVKLDQVEEERIGEDVKSEAGKIERYLLQKQKKFCSQASRFTPAIMRIRYKVDISQMFTDMELLKQTESNQGSKATTIKEVVDVIKSTPGCKALIDGEGGIGKTTILRHLSYNWATGQSINVFEGKIVFLLSVRDLEKDDDILDLIVKQQNMEDFNLDTDLPEDPKLIKRFIKRHENKIVLLIDGLDELRFENQSIISIFKRDKLEQCTVILTSRPENIDEFISECNVHVRVNGFNEESIRNYIDKHFEYFKNPQVGKSLRQELLGWQQKHPEAYSMCKNPMLLLSICILWEDNQSLPTDNADLFKEIFRSILNQFNRQEKVQKISQFQSTPVKYVNAMILLGKCMYNSLKINRLSITKNDLNTHANKDMVEMALKLGFVYEEAPISKSNFENIFMPPHKLIVESLVGFYLCKLCVSENMENECSDVRKLLTPLYESEWEVIRESEYLKGAREFAIGFLGPKVDSFLKHWITNQLSTYRSLPSNLKFVKGQHEDAVVNELIDNLTSKDLKIKEHLEDISTSIRMFIDHISPGVHCAGHFIRLIKQLHLMECTNVSLNLFCSMMASDCKGRVIAHILGINANKKVTIKNLSGDVMNQMIRECSNRGVLLALNTFDIRENTLGNIDGTLLGSLLILSPNLWRLDMRNCNLSGNIMNHMIRECSRRGVQLTLESIVLSRNNLSNIDGTLLGSLLIMSPKMRGFEMSDCN